MLVHMVELLFLRHGQTDWNSAGRIQGHVDTRISTPAKMWLDKRRLPARFARFKWICSPLIRARQTAASLGADGADVEPRLIEMSWGKWEGETLEALRQAHGVAMRENEARGLDFRPCGGESPRELRERLRDWLHDVVSDGEPVVAVTHKGVIRCALALATDWDLLDKPPVRLQWNRAHLFNVTPPDGSLCIVEPNIELIGK